MIRDEEVMVIGRFGVELVTYASFLLLFFSSYSFTVSRLKYYVMNPLLPGTARYELVEPSTCDIAPHKNEMISNDERGFLLYI